MLKLSLGVLCSMTFICLIEAQDIYAVHPILKYLIPKNLIPVISKEDIYAVNPILKDPIPVISNEVVDSVLPTEEVDMDVDLTTEEADEDGLRSRRVLMEGETTEEPTPEAKEGLLGLPALPKLRPLPTLAPLKLFRDSEEDQPEEGKSKLNIIIAPRSDILSPRNSPLGGDILSPRNNPLGGNVLSPQNSPIDVLLSNGNQNGLLSPRQPQLPSLNNQPSPLLPNPIGVAPPAVLPPLPPLPPALPPAPLPPVLLPPAPVVRLPASPDFPDLRLKNTLESDLLKVIDLTTTEEPRALQGNPDLYEQLYGEVYGESNEEATPLVSDSVLEEVQSRLEEVALNTGNRVEDITGSMGDRADEAVRAVGGRVSDTFSAFKDQNSVFVSDIIPGLTSRLSRVGGEGPLPSYLRAGGGRRSAPPTYYYEVVIPHT